MLGTLPLPAQVRPLGDYEPLIVASSEAFDRFWPLAKPLLARSVRNANRGEFEITDVEVLIRSGKLVLIVLTNDRSGTNANCAVSLAFVCELTPYPRLTILNIVALGGTALHKAHEKFWGFLLGWAYLNGARAIEGWVHPGMQKILTRFGFEPVYTHMRFDLSEHARDA